MKDTFRAEVKNYTNVKFTHFTLPTAVWPFYQTLRRDGMVIVVEGTDPTFTVSIHDIIVGSMDEKIVSGLNSIPTAITELLKKHYDNATPPAPSTN